MESSPSPSQQQQQQQQESNVDSWKITIPKISYSARVVAKCTLEMNGSELPGYKIHVSDSSGSSWFIYRLCSVLQKSRANLIKTPVLPCLKSKLSKLPIGDFSTVETTQKFFDELKSLSTHDSVGLMGLFEFGRTHWDKSFQYPQLPPVPESCTGARVLVTGANGYVGSSIVKDLLARGYNVVGTVRNPSDKKKYGFLSKLPGADSRLKLVKVENLTDENAFDEHVKDIDYVLHTASPFALGVDPVNDLIIPAVQGTLSIMRSITKNGNSVKRMVLTSSCASVYCFGDSSRETAQIRTEKTWNHDSTETMQPYNLSKTLAEASAWKFMKEIGMKFSPQLEAELLNVFPVNEKYVSKDLFENLGPNKSWDLVVINPSLIQGPLVDAQRLSESVGLFDEMLNGKQPALFRFAFGACDIRDVVNAHIRGFEVPTAWGRHIIAPTSVWLQEQMQMVVYDQPNFPIPSMVAPRFIVLFFSLFDKRFSLSEMRKIEGTIPHFSSQKTYKNLEFAPISLSDSLCDMMYSLIRFDKLDKTKLVAFKSVEEISETESNTETMTTSEVTLTTDATDATTISGQPAAIQSTPDEAVLTTDP